MLRIDCEQSRLEYRILRRQPILEVVALPPRLVRGEERVLDDEDSKSEHWRLRKREEKTELAEEEKWTYCRNNLSKPPQHQPLSAASLVHLPHIGSSQLRRPPVDCCLHSERKARPARRKGFGKQEKNGAV